MFAENLLYTFLFPKVLVSSAVSVELKCRFYNLEKSVKLLSGSWIEVFCFLALSSLKLSSQVNSTVKVYFFFPSLFTATNFS